MWWWNKIGNCLPSGLEERLIFILSICVITTLVFACGLLRAFRFFKWSTFRYSFCRVQAPFILVIFFTITFRLNNVLCRNFSMTTKERANIPSKDWGYMDRQTHTFIYIFLHNVYFGYLLEAVILKLHTDIIIIKIKKPLLLLPPYIFIIYINSHNLTEY